MLTEMDSESNGRVVVLGVGNEIMTDDGVGVHVARALASENLAATVEIIEGATIIDCLPGGEPIDKLIVVDAVSGGDEPGAIYRFTPDQIEVGAVRPTSIHQLGLIDSLKMSEIAGIKPRETVVIGVEPKKVELGMELSPEIQNRIPEVVSIVLKEISPGQRKSTG